MITYKTYKSLNKGGFSFGLSSGDIVLVVFLYLGISKVFSLLGSESLGVIGLPVSLIFVYLVKMTTRKGFLKDYLKSIMRGKYHVISKSDTSSKSH